MERHPKSLHLWGSILATHIQSPDQEIAEADEERDDAEAPNPAFPLVDGTKENHQARPNHEEDDAAAKIGTLPNDRWRIEKRLGNGLAFLDHHPHGLMH